ncbi:MAG TPA: hypothetical protein VMB48_07965 [Steroidobacteraceae bacterium]|nr:hypothetical protein [Steroidobacteraceae bacterium]
MNTHLTADASAPKHIPRAAARSVFYSQWAYWCTLLMAWFGYSRLSPGTARTVLIATPVLTALLVVGTTWWVYRACDEYIRLRILRCVAVTAVILAFATLGYFFLELSGYPRLSMIAVNLLGWSVFNLLLLYVVYRSR